MGVGNFKDVVTDAGLKAPFCIMTAFCRCPAGPAGGRLSAE